MLLPHIIYLHRSKCTVGNGLLKSKSRMIGMHMYLDYILVGYAYYGITYGLQVFLEISLCLLIEDMIQHDYEFRTISVFDLGIGHGIPVDARYMLSGGSLKILCSEV